ncbi:MAG: multifunctional oxoglutarate decarboxylase/oxoglutarate dehydrogenase thiamine pyrophosphate-binding subunit/dihydrolipoyllysine-residue succinyltransferase subunit, partial [Rhodothermia bacterium]|nr:multifunctional oxoglutarate decarboxylase/oxoglutarate dehydrogenase thiamine pyrophosphate-binding subunit/dihydrolipoyllysine-residue succinyltransferase subunit [Rhodothermia bacterium]
AEVDDPDRVKRVVFCSGKVYFDLQQAVSKLDDGAARPALVRVEQFYPFPANALSKEVERFGNADEFIWAQEEPKNMGAWSFIFPRLDAVLAERTGRDCGNVQYRGRAASASPSTGSAKVHQFEQEKLVSEVLGLSQAT